jgi:hypothetical protein
MSTPSAGVASADGAEVVGLEGVQLGLEGGAFEFALDELVFEGGEFGALGVEFLLLRRAERREGSVQRTQHKGVVYTDWARGNNQSIEAGETRPTRLRNDAEVER